MIAKMLHDVLKELLAPKLREATEGDGFPLARIQEYQNTATLMEGVADLLTHSYRSWSPECFLALLVDIDQAAETKPDDPASINHIMRLVMEAAGIGEPGEQGQVEALGLAAEVSRLAWLVRASLPELTRMADGRFMKIDARSELLRPVHPEEASQILAARAVYEGIHRQFLGYARLVAAKLLPNTTPPTPLSEIQPPMPS